jgi:putative tryptophan/tyrosine transport system substrate-binding protein
MHQVQRRYFLIAAGALLAAPLAARAQQPARIARIGFLGAGSAYSLATYIEAFRQGLHEAGYVEGKNIMIEYRWAEDKYERLPDLAAQLLQIKVDVIVTEGTNSTQVARNATKNIPIVMALAGDPVGSGLIQSLARPGSNVTGVTTLSLELVGKQMQMLKAIVPGLGRMALLWDPVNAAAVRALKGIETDARSLGLELQLIEARAASELDRAFSALAKKRPGALTVTSSLMFDGQQRRIADLAAQHRLPAIYSKTPFAEAGGLISYGANFHDLFKRASVYVDKILKGAKPVDLPVEQPIKFELVINLKSAKTLALTIPQSLLLRADRVIQ